MTSVQTSVFCRSKSITVAGRVWACDLYAVYAYAGTMGNWVRDIVALVAAPGKVNVNDPLSG